MFNYSIPYTPHAPYGDGLAIGAANYVALSWLEQRWVDWYVWVGNPVLATGIMSFVFHEIVYFGRCIPWIIIDRIPYFRKWKLQPNKIPTAEEQWACTKHLLISHFTVQIPQIWLFHPMAEHFGMRTYQVPFPSWQTMLGQIAFFFVFEDAYHYVAHQALHIGPLYRHIHKLHHKYSAPFGLAAEYAHPLEMLILGLGTLAGPWICCWATGNMHIITVYLWILLRLWQAIDAHSGYEFPWSLHNWFPLWSGAEHHDFHHMAFTNNYSTSFRHLDYLFGTDSKYRAYKARLKAARLDERAALNKVLLDGVERDGEIAEKQAEGAWDRKNQ